MALNLRETWWKRIKWLLALAFFATVAWLLYSRGREMDWSEVWTSLRAFDLATLAKALAFTALAFLAFGSYDLIAKRHLRHTVPAPRVLAIAVVAYALNVNLGALIGGWASRFRLYSRVGISPATTTQIIGLGLLSNWSGYVLIGGLIFTLAPPQLPASWPVGSHMLPFIGGALLIAITLYLALCAFKPGQLWKIRRFELRAPPLHLAALQLLVSAIHWLAVCMVVSSFLPDELAFTTVMGVLLMSSIAGAAMHIPAGLGVIEAVFVAALGDRYHAAQLVGALLAYRATFYLAPLLLSLAAYPFLEIRSGRRDGKPAAAPQWAKG